jgi:hypothetical protein
MRSQVTLLRAFLRLLGFLLRPQPFDGGDHLVFPGEFDIGGRAVRRQLGHRCAQPLQQFRGFVEFVAMDVRLAIGPGLVIRRQGTFRSSGCAR